MKNYLEGSRILLRPIKDTDTDHIIEWRNNESIRKFFIYQQPFTKEGHEKWLKEMIGTQNGFQFIVVDRESGRDIGSTYLRDYDRIHNKIEYGIFLSDTETTGHGLGTEALKLTVQFAFQELHVHKITGRIFSDNVRSLRVSEKAGFQKEALLKDEVLVQGRYRDLVLVGQINPEHQ